jgi:phospholipid transport system substrate-binding protein
MYTINRTNNQFHNPDARTHHGAHRAHEVKIATAHHATHLQCHGRTFSRLMMAKLLLLLALSLMAIQSFAQAKPDANASPDVFVQAVADQALVVLQNDPEVKNKNIGRINEIVDLYVLPYVDFAKTTRLSAGKYWRQATPEQREQLTVAFRQTLARTYSGALSRIDSGTKMDVQPLRAEPDAKDVVVRSRVMQSQNSQTIGIDYRLEKTPTGWKIYDINVENIWLIQNYRNQFSQQINANGIDGLIAALNERNSK